MEAITKFKFDDLTQAWHGLHEYMFNNEEKIKQKGGGIYGSELVSFNNIIFVTDCTMDPDFNFGRVLGYKVKKWSKLINNYVNLNYLDLIKHEVIERELKRPNSYNYTYHFDNVHGSGKDCLISLTFHRRKGVGNPIVIYHTRASEITKRLAFDFLLIQRIVEYVYGKETKVSLMCFIPFMFINLECSLMYVAEFGRKKSIKKGEDGYSKYQERLLNKFKWFKEVDSDTIKYKVHQRAARQVQRDENGNPIANCPDLFSKDMDLYTSSKMERKDLANFGEPKEGRAPKMDVVVYVKKIRRILRKKEPDKEQAAKASTAIMTGTEMFWPKDWDKDILKVLSKPVNKDYAIRASKILLDYASQK